MNLIKSSFVVVVFFSCCSWWLYSWLSQPGIVDSASGLAAVDPGYLSPPFPTSTESPTPLSKPGSLPLYEVSR